MASYHPQTEPHAHLLQGGRFGHVPAASVQLTDQMERGGAKIEEALARMNCKYQTLFFLSSWGITIASIMAMINATLTFQFASLLSAHFMLGFGVVMILLDIPGSPRWAAQHRYNVRKQCRFLTRLTGKSLWFLYLSCMVLLTLWPSHRNEKRGILMFASLLTSGFVAFVSLIGLFIAMRKTLRLERIRKALNAHFKGNAPEVYRKYAITDPSHGMQFEEFNRLCADYSQGALSFDIVDLAIIYNALDDHQKSALNEREFGEWMSGSMTYL